MKNSIKKMMGIIFTIIFVIAMMPSYARAEDDSLEAVILVKSSGEKIIYIKGLDSTDFKYAFSNNEEEANTVTYKTCLTDSNGENVVYLTQNETYKYMFISNGESVETVDLETLKSITEEEILEIEGLTTKISVDTEKSTSYSETTEDGTSVTTTLGKIVITEEGNYTYQYQLIEILDKNNTVTEINETAVELYAQISELENASTMFEKLSAEITIRDDYKQLLENATWVNVNENTILQPEDSQEGEKYIVLLQKLEGDNVVENDIQFMTCGREDDADVEYTEKTETKLVEKRTELPVTGENLVLYIVLVIIIIAIIIVAIRMKKLKGKENEK